MMREVHYQPFDVPFSLMLQTHGAQFTIFTHSVLFSIFIILIHICLTNIVYLYIFKGAILTSHTCHGTGCFFTLLRNKNTQIPQVALVDFTPDWRQCIFSNFDKKITQHGELEKNLQNYLPNQTVCTAARNSAALGDVNMIPGNGLCSALHLQQQQQLLGLRSNQRFEHPERINGQLMFPLHACNQPSPNVS